MNNKEKIRKMLINQRNALSDEQQKQHGQSIVQQIEKITLWHTAMHIGLYYPKNGEISTKPLIQLIWSTPKKTGYIPKILHKHQRLMCFIPWLKNQTLRPSIAGIPVPEHTKKEEKSPQALSIVFTPLVGFNQTGLRLGMGGGYYDKTFESTRNRPVLIGLAHSLQEIYDILPASRWDIPLDGVITEKKSFSFTPKGLKVLQPH